MDWTIRKLSSSMSQFNHMKLLQPSSEALGWVPRIVSCGTLQIMLIVLTWICFQIHVKLINCIFQLKNNSSGLITSFGEYSDNYLLYVIKYKKKLLIELQYFKFKIGNRLFQWNTIIDLLGSETAVNNLRNMQKRI